MNKIKDRQKKKNKNKQPKTLFDTYQQKDTQGDLNNTLLKGGVDILTGSIVGTLVGALSRKSSLLTGTAITLLGHYLGDQTGISRLIGASTIGYGIGKAKEYKNNPKPTQLEDRISALQDDWLAALHIKWEKDKKENNPKKQEQKQPTEKQEKQATDTPLNSSVPPTLKKKETQPPPKTKPKTITKPFTSLFEDNIDLSQL